MITLIEYLRDGSIRIANSSIRVSQFLNEIASPAVRALELILTEIPVYA